MATRKRKAHQISTLLVMLFSDAYSSVDCTSLAASLSVACASSRYTDREGVLMFLARLMISVRRGTPRVTFLADTPAGAHSQKCQCTIMAQSKTSAVGKCSTAVWARCCSRAPRIWCAWADRQPLDNGHRTVV